MPVLSSQNFATNEQGQITFSPARLMQHGPIIDVVISIPQPLAELYTKLSKAIPSPISGIGLIDTGATKSCVHDTIMKQLGVSPIGVATSGTAAGQVQHSLYPAHCTFPSAGINSDFPQLLV